jgi:hypothetical protein
MPGLISSFPGTVGLPPFVSSSTANPSPALRCDAYERARRVFIAAAIWLLARDALAGDQANISATLRTSFPRTCPVSIISCARAAFSSGSTSMGGTRTTPRSIK